MRRQPRNLLSDAKFETKVNEENRQNWIQSVKEQMKGNNIIN